MQTLNLYQKLLAIQSQVMGLGKNKETKAYSYVTGSKVLAEIKPLMNRYGLLLKQEVLSIENSRQDYFTAPGTQRQRAQSEINSKVMMRFTWIDTETGARDENLFGANGQNEWDKGVGSALTYAERYFLLKYFHIATDEDDIDNLRSEDGGVRRDVGILRCEEDRLTREAIELRPEGDTAPVAGTAVAARPQPAHATGLAVQVAAAVPLRATAPVKKREWLHPDTEKWHKAVAYLQTHPQEAMQKIRKNYRLTKASEQLLSEAAVQRAEVG